jgi:hypothetical protein
VVDARSEQGTHFSPTITRAKPPTGQNAHGIMDSLCWQRLLLEEKPSFSSEELSAVRQSLDMSDYGISGSPKSHARGHCESYEVSTSLVPPYLSSPQSPLLSLLAMFTARVSNHSGWLHTPGLSTSTRAICTAVRQGRQYSTEAKSVLFTSKRSSSYRDHVSMSLRPAKTLAMKCTIA